MRKIKLIEIAHGRSGDKVMPLMFELIAYDDNGYKLLRNILLQKK